jgi:hypothetical protein
MSACKHNPFDDGLSAINISRVLRQGRITILLFFISDKSRAQASFLIPLIVLDSDA